MPIYAFRVRSREYRPIGTEKLRHIMNTEMAQKTNFGYNELNDVVMTTRIGQVFMTIMLLSKEYLP